MARELDVDCTASAGTLFKNVVPVAGTFGMHPLSNAAAWDAAIVAASGTAGAYGPTFNTNIIGGATVVCASANQRSGIRFVVDSLSGISGLGGIMLRSTADGSQYYDINWSTTTLTLRYRNGGSFPVITSRAVAISSAVLTLSAAYLMFGESIGSTHTVYLQRESDGLYLNTSDAWVSGKTAWLSGTEGTISAAGRAGVRLWHNSIGASDGLKITHWYSEEIAGLAAGTLRINYETPYCRVAHTWADYDASAATGGSGTYTQQLYLRLSGVGSYEAVSGATALKDHIDGLTPGTAYDAYIEYDDGTDTVQSDPVTFTTMAQKPLAVLAHVENSWGVPHTLSFGQGAPALLAAAFASRCVSYFYANGGQTWTQLDAQASAPNSTADYTTDIDDVLGATNGYEHLAEIPDRICSGFEDLNTMVGSLPAAVMSARETFFTNRRTAGASHIIAWTVPDSADNGNRTDANAATLSTSILADGTQSATVDIRQSAVFHNGTSDANTNATYWNGDGLHINAAGQQERADLAEPVIEDVLDTIISRRRRYHARLLMAARA